MFLFLFYKLSLNSLFDICTFKPKENIKNDFKDICSDLSKLNKTISINDDKMTEKYIEAKTNIAKKCMPLLLKKCKEEMKKYLETQKEEDKDGHKKEKNKKYFKKFKRFRLHIQ